MIKIEINSEYAKTLYREISDILEYEYNKENNIKQKRQKMIKADNVEVFLTKLAEAILEDDFNKANKRGEQNDEH